MKSLAIGCAGLVLGIIIGTVLAFGVNALFASRAAENVVVPQPLPGQPDVSVTTSTAYINAQIQPIARSSGLARQMTLTFSAPNLCRAVVVSDLGAAVTLNATITLRVAVQNNRIVLTVQDTQVSGASIVQVVVSQQVEKIRAQAEEQINRQLQRALQGTGMRLVGINITPSDVTLQFKTGQ
ncbi:MAG: hypothetical protein HY868_10720 [Chloroflexi bacterium]|nr:hypothetical protein [Chloroflexota bacterium]